MLNTYVPAPSVRRYYYYAPDVHVYCVHCAPLFISISEIIAMRVRAMNLLIFPTLCTTHSTDAELHGGSGYGS